MKILMAYVYKHIRLDNNQIFYIGISNNIKNYYRASLRAKRNKFWKNIVEKTEYKIEIIYDNLTLEEAKEKEKVLIKFYGRRDLKLGTLCNLTNGGDGCESYICTQEIKDKISKTLKEKNYKTTPKINSEIVIDICNKIMIGYRHMDIQKIYPIVTVNMYQSILKKRCWKEITTTYDFPKLLRIYKPTEEVKDKISKTLKNYFLQNK